jgi:hypothetical protein
MLRLSLLLVLAFVAAGCMGGKEDGVSTEDYVARADGVCGDYQVRLSRIPRPVTAEPAELGTFLERALPIAREQLDELQELPKPSNEDDRERVDRLLGLLEQELELNEAAQEAAAGGDAQAANVSLQQGAPLSAEANQLAEELGFVVCARRA